MAIADFLHLKVRSAYSLTEGANKVDAVVALAKAQAMPAVAVTDRIAQATPEQIKIWAGRLLSARTLDDVFADN